MLKNIIEVIRSWFLIPTHCPYCGKTFSTEKGKNIHIGKMHK